MISFGSVANFGVQRGCAGGSAVLDLLNTTGGPAMMSFKGAQFPKEVILFAVFFYVRDTVSRRDLEEIMTARGVEVDHARLDRGVATYSPLIAENARRQGCPPTDLGAWTKPHQGEGRVGSPLPGRLRARKDP